MRVPVRITVLTMFSVLMIVIVGAVSFSNYRQGEISALETARELIRQSKVSTAENTRRLLGVTSTVANTVTRMPNEMAGATDPFIFADYLRTVIADVPQIYSTFIGFPDGRFVQALNFKLVNGEVRSISGIPPHTASAVRTMEPIESGQNRRQIWRYYDSDNNEISVTESESLTTYDPRERSWFRRALDHGTLGASEVYVFQSLREPGLTISSPMINVAGAVVGIDIPLDSLANFVAGQKPSENGQVAIVAQDGHLIAHPDPSIMIKRSRAGKDVSVVKVAELEDDRIRVAGTFIGGETAVEETVHVSGHQYVLSVQPIQAFANDRWYIVGVAAVEDFTGTLRESLNRAVLVAALLLFCALFIVYVVSTWITQPLSTASDFASRISQLDIDADTPKSSPFSEIQSLRASMVAMRDAIQMFLRYAPKDLVHVLVQSGTTAEIGGTRKDIAVLFTDIEGFTSINEKEAPEDILIQTSIYFEALTNALTDNRAIVDKFIGDAIMALWNTPVSDEYFVDNACLGTLAAFVASDQLNRDMSANNFPVFKTRFGLHTGEALVGNVGSPERMQYTALGPVINLASRIEGMNKFYGTNVLVSGDIRKKASGHFVFRKIDVVEAKGTTIPVEIYELMGVDDEEDSPCYVSPDAKKAKEIYEAGLEKYIAADFQGALDTFEEILMADPENGAALILAERCYRYLTNPPEDWQGVYSFESK